MTSRRAWIAGLAGMALAAPSAMAQVPPFRPGLRPAGRGPPPLSRRQVQEPRGEESTVAVAGGAQPTTLWSFLGLSGSNLAACKQKLCASQFGQMANSLVTGPVGAVSGGFIPPLCPPAPNAAAIAGMPGGPAGAEATAATIKASEADAKARVAAVDYLATVDCSHWPEATKALKNALRADPNECVRFAAATALNSGCCCSKEIIDSLTVCVSGTGSDGEAPENSPRVKAAAFAALQNCLMRVPANPPEVPLVPEPRLEPEPPSMLPAPIPDAPPITPERTTTGRSSAATHLAAAHYPNAPRELSYQEQLRRKSFAQTIDDARRTLHQVAQRPSQAKVLPPGKQTVLHALIKAREDLDTRPKTTYPAAPGRQIDPGVSQSSYTAPPAPPATATMSVNPYSGANDAIARRVPPISVATALDPYAGGSNGTASRTAPGVDPASSIETRPVPMAGEPNNVAQTAAEIPSTSDAQPERSYQGGLIGILLRRTRKQTDQ